MTRRRLSYLDKLAAFGHDVRMTTRSPIQLCYAWHQAECRVTITGADDRVEPKELVELSQKYPFVEWGILVSHNRVGTSRYPSMRWSREATGMLAVNGAHFAIHLCGETRAYYQRNRLESVALVERLTQDAIVPTQCRVQLNGFDHSWEGFEPANPFVPHILPVKRGNIFGAAAKRYGFEAQLLFDESGGRGKAVDFEAAGDTIEEAMKEYGPNLSFGMAGGIKPETVVDAISFNLRKGGWIDLESGVRTNDEFDMSKVEAVLEAASKAFG